MIPKLADFLIRFRLWVLVAIIAVTTLFGYYAIKVPMYSMFDDLLPPKHTYIKIHRQYKDVFGGANIVLISIEARQGDIYKPSILKKIQSFTETLELTKGVNNYQIYSIARYKVKDITATAWGIEMQPIMWPAIPQTEEEITKLINVIHANDTIWGKLVSLDDKAALITAVFFEGKMDYRYLFKRFQEAKKSLEDESVSIYLAGEPILYGWIYHHLYVIAWIFGFTLLAIVILLALLFRQQLGVTMPMISGGVSALWGVGLMGMLGYNFDPLILVVPFLISARSLSHSVQMTARYIEEYTISGDKKIAAREAFVGLFAPGAVGIVTDAVGVLIIAVAPIPLLTKLAFVGSLWVISNLISATILDPVLLSYLPVPRKMKSADPEKDRLGNFLGKCSRVTFGKKSSWVIIGIAVLILVVSLYYERYLMVGDAHHGSPLLWPDSEYNISVGKVNERFPGVDQLMVVVEGKEADSTKFPQVFRTMESLQREVLDIPGVGGASSLGGICKKMNSVLHYDNPSWLRFPKDRMDIGMLFEVVQVSTEPGDFDKWVNYNFKDSNIIIYLKDHKGDTIRRVIQGVKDFIDKHPMEQAEFKLAGGLIGMLAAANEVIMKSHIWNLSLILSFTFLCCAVAYRSFVAGFLFIISLCLANFFTLTVMSIREIGLNVNTLPVVSLGIGLGVDYGLYMVSRIREEYIPTQDLKAAIPIALATTGRAVVVTAITMVTGIIFWYFSPLRFQAEMGLLLSIVLVMNLLGALFLLPTLIYLIKPKFCCKEA